MKKIFLTITLVLILCTQALAESSVWKVQKGASVFFLGGTFHLLRPTDFPLPPEFEKAYKASDLLVFETDLNTLNAISAQQKLMANAMYVDGSTIDKYLSADTYSLLNKYCASNGIPLESLKHFRPSIIAVTLLSVELAKLGVSKQGVDTYFYQLATQDKKAIEGLETVDEQIQSIVRMGEGNEDAFITSSLRDLESIKQKYETMVAAWKKGDVRKLNDLFVAEIKAKMPKLYKELLVDRNAKWLPTIDAFHKTPQKEFILVGASHLVGPDGIIEALRQKGYTVEKL